MLEVKFEVNYTVFVFVLFAWIYDYIANK